MEQTHQDDWHRLRSPALRANAVPVQDESASTAPEVESYDDGFDTADTEPEPITPQTRRRILTAILVVVVLGLLAVLPPLINVNRYRRRIATSISGSLGRPVHLDSVSLNILPTPSFVLTNFVVEEDPAFGAEPVIRANTVRATLRMRSLWHRQVEFSKISLEEPSVNLVHREDGKWNVESILLQASRLRVLPTEERPASGTQRFPYIEATGGRVNLKRGLEKMPLSLTDAEFALWLPKPDLWHLRLQAHPARTNTAATDTGTLEIDGTLGKASLLEDVPVSLHGAWSGAPLGAASWVALGRDAGLRGEMTLRANLQGPLGAAALDTKVELRHLRRADFVPAKTLNVDLACKAKALETMHRMEDLRCVWPTADGSGGLAVTGSVADVRLWRTADLEAKWQHVPLASVMDAARVASHALSPALVAFGSTAGELHCCATEGSGVFSGTVEAKGAGLGLAERNSFLTGADILADLEDDSLEIPPVPLDLGAPQPAQFSVKLDANGVRMRLTGGANRARLLALASALPQFGQGLTEALPEPVEGSVAPLHLDLVGSRVWGSPQIWAQAPVAAPPKRRRRAGR